MRKRQNPPKRSKAFGKTPKSMSVNIQKKKWSAYKSMLNKHGVNKKAKFK